MFKITFFQLFFCFSYVTFIAILAFDFVYAIGRSIILSLKNICVSYICVYFNVYIIQINIISLLLLVVILVFVLSLYVTNEMNCIGSPNLTISNANLKTVLSTCHKRRNALQYSFQFSSDVLAKKKKKRRERVKRLH